jgi:hypothetical protein
VSSFEFKRRERDDLGRRWSAEFIRELHHQNSFWRDGGKYMAFPSSLSDEILFLTITGDNVSG